MPSFKVLDRDRIQELTKRGGSGGVDLTEYKNWVNDAAREGWGSIGLDTGDNIRALKRRTTIAGKELGKVVKWHRKSTPQELIFQVLDTPPAKRQRRKNS